MKNSQYNIYLPTSDNKVIIFNSLSKKFFYFSENNFSNLKNIIENPNHYMESEDYKDLLFTLNKNGFVIKDNVEEINIIESMYETYKESPTYSLMILTTYSCNFSCWYCIQKHAHKNLSPIIIEKIKKHIVKYLIKNNIKDFQISWFGGEPLLNFDAIRTICSFSKEFCGKNGIKFNCGITTNGSLVTSNMAKEMHHLGFKDFQITIDGNSTNHNKTRFNKLIPDSFTTILENIRLLTKFIPDVEITLRINYTLSNLTPEMIGEIDSILQESKNNIELLFRKVWQEPHSKELYKKLKDILSEFKRRGYKILQDYDNIKLTSCYVEQTHYNTIFPDGTVDKCSNIELSEARGFLSNSGDIIWNEQPSENSINIFNHNSECKKCVYLPLCMGPCPKNRTGLIHENKIHCHYDNKDEIFLEEIKNFITIKSKEYDAI